MIDREKWRRYNPDMTLYDRYVEILADPGKLTPEEHASLRKSEFVIDLSVACSDLIDRVQACWPKVPAARLRAMRDIVEQLIQEMLVK